MSFGENIRKFREKKGMSQRDLAEKLGVKQQTIAQYERATKTPKVETVNKLAAALGVNATDLIDSVPLRKVTQTDKESNFFYDCISPILKSLGYTDITFIGNTHGNKIKFSDHGNKIEIPFSEMKMLYENTEELISNIRVAIYGNFLTKELQKDGE